MAATIAAATAETTATAATTGTAETTGTRIAEIVVGSDNVTPDDFEITIVNHVVFDGVTSSTSVEIRALERSTLREWSAPFSSCMHEFEDTSNYYHHLFEYDDAPSMIQTIISDRKVKVTRNGDASATDSLTVVFSISMMFNFGIMPDIVDDLAFTLERVA